MAWPAFYKKNIEALFNNLLMTVWQENFAMDFKADVK